MPNIHLLLLVDFLYYLDYHNLLLVSCIQNSLDEMDLEKYKNVNIYEDEEIKLSNNKKENKNNEKIKI